MIGAPKITDEQKKELRYDFVRLVEGYPDQKALEAFRQEWDGNVNFRILHDRTVIANIAGEERLPPDLKEKTRQMLSRFNRSDY